MYSTCSRRACWPFLLALQQLASLPSTRFFFSTLQLEQTSKCNDWRNSDTQNSTGSPMIRVPGKWGQKLGKKEKKKKHGTLTKYSCDTTKVSLFYLRKFTRDKNVVQLTAYQSIIVSTLYPMVLFVLLVTANTAKNKAANIKEILSLLPQVKKQSSV